MGMKGKVMAWTAFGFGILLLLLGAAGYFGQLVVNGWFSGVRPWGEALGGWLGSLSCCGACFGLGMVICALFSQIFRKTTDRYCSVALFLTVLGLVATGALGAYSGLTLTFLSPARNPVAFPFYFSAAMICLGAFLGWMVLYLWLRSSRWSWRAMVLDLMVGLLFLPGFWFSALRVFSALGG